MANQPPAFDAQRDCDMTVQSETGLMQSICEAPRRKNRNRVGLQGPSINSCKAIMAAPPPADMLIIWNMLDTNRRDNPQNAEEARAISQVASMANLDTPNACAILLNIHIISRVANQTL